MTNVVPTGNHCAMHLDSDQKATNVRPQPRKGWLFFVSLIETLLVWLAFSWPLPRQVFSAIPISAQNAEKYHIRAMIPGDQLQLLYHFWLFSDMVRGKTPFFYNLYEFNTGDDRDRFNPESYFFPFSLLFSIGDFSGNQAFGWNLAAFVSLWLTLFFSWLLALRFTRRKALALGAALISIVLPYRWAQMLGGSPTGLGMMLVPMLLYGLDLAIREKQAFGAWLAGLAILFAAWTDTHVFFFSCLSLPFWTFALVILCDNFRWLRISSYLAMIRALWPVAFMAVLAFATGNLFSALSGQQVMKARGLHDTTLYAGTWNGFFDLQATGPSSHIYLGYGLAAWTAMSALVWLAVVLQRKKRESSDTRAILFLLLILGFTGLVLCLSLGPRGPFGGAAFLAIRHWISPYRMIRQAAKIFCLLPVCLLFLTALPWELALKTSRCRFLYKLWPALLVAFIVESWMRTDASLTSLDRDQGAYRLAAEDARNHGKDPRVLVLPLWPGDSHYTSVYQYYCSLYRIRMVNGYRPFLPEGYYENTFLFYESLNQGGLTGQQADHLLASGVHYILLHENLFPEKVSPFPVGNTLQKLLNHPRLELLGRDATVWAFKILPQAQPDRKAVSFMPACFPTRSWEIEDHPSVQSITNRPGSSGFGSYLRLLGEGAQVTMPGVGVVDTPPPAWCLRARGNGTIRFGTNAWDRQEQRIRTDSWKWFTVPVSMTSSYDRIRAQIVLASGEVDLDSLFLTAGNWKSPESGETVSMPVPSFFHGGFTADTFDGVVFRKNYDPVAVSIYGPKLPLDPGVYRLEMKHASEAPAQTALGRLFLNQAGKNNEIVVPVLAGQPCVIDFKQPDNLPFRATFVFDRNADMTVRDITLTRLE